MKWYVSQDGDISGPMEAAEVRRAIEAGTLRPGVHVRDEGGQWTLIEQSPFGRLFSVSAAASAVSSKSTRPSSSTGVVLALLAACAFGVYVIDWATPKAQVSSAGAKVQDEQHTVADESDQSPRAALNEWTSAGSLSEILGKLHPYMTDTQGSDMPPAAAPLGLWARERLLWSELEAMPDSRRADVMKDPDRYRGARLCSRGTVIEIHADNSVYPPVYTGGLMTASFDMVRFLAVRSTEGITADSQGRFCGIITGLQSYPNAVGGVTHGVFVVGMFDLPENRASGGSPVAVEDL